MNAHEVADRAVAAPPGRSSIRCVAKTTRNRPLSKYVRRLCERQLECELIRIRASEGRERAKANGKSLGRKFKLTAHQKQEAIR